MSSNRQTDALIAAGQAVAAGRYDEALALADEVIASSDGSPDAKAIYLRARALTSLQRDTEAEEAWEAFIERPRPTAYDQVAFAHAKYALAMLQYNHERNVTKALEASEIIVQQLASAPADQVLTLAKCGQPLLEIIVDAWFCSEGDALSRALIDADVAGTGDEGLNVDLTARLMGIVTAINLNEPARVNELFDDVVEAGEPGLRVIDHWLDRLERAGGPQRQRLIASAMTFKAVSLAQSGRHHEARQLAIDIRGRFADSADPTIMTTLSATDFILDEDFD